MADQQSGRPLSEEELQDLVTSSDAGARNPAGAIGMMLAIIAAVWSVFQVLLASPWSPYILPGDIINNSRQIHLAFAIFLAFMAYPAFKSSPRHFVPIQDWLMALGGAFIALYGFFFYQKIVDAGGLADDTDKWFALVGLLLLFEAARRALGPAMAIIATIFMAYVFFGSSEWVPEVIRWKGASLKKAMSHMWITSEGVFGIALGVSTKFVFLFVLFGALLDKAGAGNYFIKMAFGALGHLRGGPAKAAVVGSAATGLISGSSIANVVTTGTFTIPLMKRVGFSSEKAGAVEVASSVNGQIMPPVMGAAAFLMVEYVGISYVSVITHAFLPAAISYIALVYIVHLEAVKNNIKALGESNTNLLKAFLSFLFTFGFIGNLSNILFPSLIAGAIVGISQVSANLATLLAFVALCIALVLAIRMSNHIKESSFLSWLISTGGLIALFLACLFRAMYHFIRWLQEILPNGSGLASFVIIGLIVATYIALLHIASKSPDLEPDDPNAKTVELPVVSEIYKCGLYYVLPIIVLVWFLMIEQKSPGLSAFWATMLLFVILLTQKPLKAIFRGQSDMANSFASGLHDLWNGMIDGARNMIGIGLATATAGIIVGTVTLTGVGQVMANLVEFLSAGNLILMLVMVGLLSLVLGMGLPTTANYIVVSSLMAGVVVQLGAQNGLIVPLIAVHLFVFYFGIMADVTPPVGLASFAAAAVSGGDAIRTGFTAFFYSLRTVALPFVFIFNTKLLLIGLGWGIDPAAPDAFFLWKIISPAMVDGILTFVTATIAILVFTAGTMGWFLTRSRIYESLALVVIAFAMFRPDFFMDRIAPPFQMIEPTAVVSALDEAEPGSELRFVVSGPDYDTFEMRDMSLVVPVGDEASGAERLAAMGFITEARDGMLLLPEEPLFGTPIAESVSGVFEFYGDEPVRITEVKAPQGQPAQELILIPALAALLLVALLQRGRMRKEGVPA